MVNNFVNIIGIAVTDFQDIGNKRWSSYTFDLEVEKTGKNAGSVFTLPIQVYGSNTHIDTSKSILGRQIVVQGYLDSFTTKEGNHVVKMIAQSMYVLSSNEAEERHCNWEMIIWAKENPIPFCGTHYLCDKEYCLYFWENGAPVDIPFERAKTIYSSKTNVWDKKKFNHPTVKSMEITKNLILNSSQRGGSYLTHSVAVAQRQLLAATLNETL